MYTTCVLHLCIYMFKIVTTTTPRILIFLFFPICLVGHSWLSSNNNFLINTIIRFGKALGKTVLSDLKTNNGPGCCSLLVWKEHETPPRPPKKKSFSFNLVKHSIALSLGENNFPCSRGYYIYTTTFPDERNSTPFWAARTTKGLFSGAPPSPLKHFLVTKTLLIIIAFFFLHEWKSWWERQAKSTFPPKR